MTTDLRFVHAADVHLGAPFKRVGAEDARVRDALTQASERALGRIVDLAIEREADFLLLVGDVLDGTEKNLKAQLVFHREMERLAQAGIPAYVARGNHDHASGWDAGLVMPDAVTFFDEAAIERIAVSREGEYVCTLYGRSHAGAGVTEDYAAEFMREVGDAFAIGVLHTNVGTRGAEDEYAPSTTDDLRGAQMDYWALGHIHARETVLADPPAEYPGSPQGLDPSETGPHGCLIVEVSGGEAQVEFVETDEVRWVSLDVDVAANASLGDVRDGALEALDAAAGECGGRPSIARVRLTGRSAVHTDLSVDGALSDLLDDVREQGMRRDPWVWVDRLDNSVGRAIDIDELQEQRGFAGDLVRRTLVAEENADAVVERVLASVTTSGIDLPGSDIDSAELVRRARDLCLDMLARDEG